MQLRIARGSIAAAVVSVLVIAGVAQAQNDPRLGTWKLNLAKSKYTKGAPPKSTTLKYEMSGSMMKITADTVAADGATIHWEAPVAYDGKDYHITGNNPNGDMVSRKMPKTRGKINPSTVETTYKSAGKATVTNTSFVSTDGKTLTVTTRGKDAAGKEVASVAVYDKQM